MVLQLACVRCVFFQKNDYFLTASHSLSCSFLCASGVLGFGVRVSFSGFVQVQVRKSNPPLPSSSEADVQFVRVLCGFFLISSCRRCSKFKCSSKEKAGVGSS